MLPDDLYENTPTIAHIHPYRQLQFIRINRVFTTCRNCARIRTDAFLESFNSFFPSLTVCLSIVITQSMRYLVFKTRAGHVYKCVCRRQNKTKSSLRFAFLMRKSCSHFDFFLNCLFHFSHFYFFA